MELLDIRTHLKVVRDQLKLTQDDIADRAGISQSVVSKLENPKKKVKEVEFESIRKWVELGFEMSLSAFFLQIENPSKTTRIDEPVYQKGDTKALPSKDEVGAHGDRAVSDRQLAPIVERTVVNFLREVLAAGLHVAELKAAGTTRKHRRALKPAVHAQGKRSAGRL